MAKLRSLLYLDCMSYLTVEVKIDQGRIIPSEPEKLPQNGSALLTILDNEGPRAKQERRPYGLGKGEFVVPDNFNDPLPEETLREFEGK
jgi:hypothetical protein